jgi:hypothetical protein
LKQFLSNENNMTSVFALTVAALGALYIKANYPKDYPVL